MVPPGLDPGFAALGASPVPLLSQVCWLRALSGPPPAEHQPPFPHLPWEHCTPGLPSPPVFPEHPVSQACHGNTAERSTQAGVRRKDWQPGTPLPCSPRVPGPPVSPIHPASFQPVSQLCAGPLPSQFSHESGSSPRNLLSIFSLSKKKQIYRSGVLLSLRVQGLHRKVREGARQLPRAVHGPPRASLHWPLELGFPEISPRALGDRSHARPGVRLARGAGAGMCLVSPAARSWLGPTGTWGRTRSLREGRWCLRLQEWGPCVGHGGHLTRGPGDCTDY